MRRLLLCLCLLAAAHPGLADPIQLPLMTQPDAQCRQAIALAARAHGIPPGLMAAMAQVESGRRDPASGLLRPWPWTVDAEGQGTFHETKAQAIAAVRAMQARGVRSIDVGCMQVNLMHHPDAFTGLDQAFDPMANADYAARFLLELHAQTQSWPKATAQYHSSTPELGDVYQQKVMALWPQGIGQPARSLTFARAWGGTFGGGILPPPPRRDSGARVIARAAAPGAVLPPGRGLEAYRAAPIAMGWRRAAK